MACRGMDPAKTQRGHGVATSGSGMGAARNAARLSALLLEHALRSSGESGELLYCAAGSSRSRRRPRRHRWYEFRDRVELDEYFRTEPYCVNGSYQHIEIYDSTR